MHVQAHDVADLLDQLWVRRQLESFTAVRLQPESMPDAADGHPAESCGFG
jgi:hypothetical protein